MPNMTLAEIPIRLAYVHPVLGPQCTMADAARGTLTTHLRHALPASARPTIPYATAFFGVQFQCLLREALRSEAVEA